MDAGIVLPSTVSDKSFAFRSFALEMLPFGARDLNVSSAALLPRRDDEVCTRPTDFGTSSRRSAGDEAPRAGIFPSMSPLG